MTFDWLRLVILLGQSDCRVCFFLSSIFLQGINQYLRFFAWRYSLKEGSIRGYHFLLDVASFSSWPIRNVISQTTTFSWVWLVVTLIQSVAEFLDHQYFWKQLSNLLDFLHGDNHLGNVGCETTSFGLVTPVLRFIQSDCRILSS